MPLSLTKIFNPRRGWYRGDFHAHTNYSDGALSPVEFVQLAKSEGLDFCAVTDHNRATAFPHFGETGDLLILPGIEVTYNTSGHFNVFGLQETDDWLNEFMQGKSWKEAAKHLENFPPSEIMRGTAQRGLLNSINHPFLKPWEWNDGATNLEYVHCLEIWNDPSYPENQIENPRAIALWTDLLNEGYRVTGIGGSDFHRPKPPAHQNKPAERLGLPGTYVFAENLSAAAILDGLRQRRVWVSMGAKASFSAEVNGVTYDIGADVGTMSGAIKLSASVSECPRPALVHVVKNGKPLAEKRVSTDRCDLQCDDLLSLDESVWYRLDVMDDNGQMLAITNPIFTGVYPIPSRKHIGKFEIKL